MSVALVTTPDFSPSRESAGVRNLQQLIQLRWIAVVGQVLAIACAHFALAIDLPVQPTLLVLAMLVAVIVALYVARADATVLHLVTDYWNRFLLWAQGLVS